MDKAQSLRELNRHIRNAATAGNVEEMIILIERRRQFLDTLAPSLDVDHADLCKALAEAVDDNNHFVKLLEDTIKLARTRGKVTLQARRQYTGTQASH